MYLAKNTLFSLFCLVAFILPIHNTVAKTLELNAATSAPLSTPDQTGFLDLVATEAFSRIGITLKTVQLPAQRSLLDSNTGLLDGELIRVKGMEKLYPNLIPVPEKIIDMDFVAISKKNYALDNGWNSLATHSIAHIKGWKIYEHKVPPITEKLAVKDIDQLLNCLLKDRTDMILFEKWEGLHQLKINNISTAKIISPPLATKEMYIFLHKKHFRIVNKLAIALKEMKNDGTYQNMFNKMLLPLEKNL